MDKEESVTITGERIVNGEKFYPIHLTNRELGGIIQSLLDITGSAEKPRLQVLIRKDKSGKGLDFRIQSVWLDYRYADRNSLITLGINPQWKVIDCFVHYQVKRVHSYAKCVDVLHGDAEKKITGVYIAELDSIYQKRITGTDTIKRNDLFLRDDWVIVYEKQDVLAD